jgi:putative ABC transport system substrate-binding protein
MKRRELIALVGGAAAWPLVARAQRSAMPVIGFVHLGSADQYAIYVAAFLRGLKETGHSEGQNVAIEFRWAEGRTDRLDELVADLVERKVALIVAIPFLPARAAMAATTTIPIVFEGGSDPVAAGLVASLNRPGGNVTGVSNLGVGLIAKHFEIMHELVPGAKAIAVLLNPNVQANFATSLKESQMAATALGVELQILQAGTATEIDSAFSAMATKRVGALIVSTDCSPSAPLRQIEGLHGGRISGSS